MSFTFFSPRPAGSYRKADTTLVVMTLLLWGLGMVTLYFCSAGFGQRTFGDPLHFVVRQLLSSLIGFIALLFFASVKLEVIRKLLPIITFTSIILCLLVFVPGIGVERNGARRWIRLPFFSTFQPSETVKFAMVLFLANLFDKQARAISDEDQSVFPAFLGLVVFTSVIFMQSDFSSGLFTFLVGLVLFFVSGSKLSWLFPFAGVGIPFAVLMILLEPFRMNRILGFLAPDSYQQTFNYQTFAARRAISSGGFWGQGIGSGLVRTNSIPEVQSDYVFAGWTEAMGLLGVILYFVLLGFFAWRAFYCACKCSDRFGALGTFGFATTIVAQSLMNIAVVGGVIPTTGIPLPFFSSGGSSIIFTLAMCGFMINASRLEFEQKGVENSVGELGYE